jgi:multidrug resistance efflux pump
MKGWRAFNYWPQVMVLTFAAFAYLAYRYFAYHDTRSTDAYVSANVINIAPLVSGPITKIYVKDNQVVAKGQKLLEIDPRPYDYAMQKRKADLAIAKLDYENDKFRIAVAQEKVKQNQDLLNLSLDHIGRYKKLENLGDLAKIELVNIQAKARAQEAAVTSASEELKITQKNLDTSRILAATAIYNEAQYLYQHTTIVAPEAGYVTNLNVRRGQYVKEGEGLFALVETGQWWVVTRYRETALRLIKPGDKAKIKLDMYPGKIFYGHVRSIGWGINRVQSGAVAPSTLAYLEPTEDWIRIAQRFPVRIYFDEIDPKYPLRIGANATTITYR